jgi:Holliday junction DNA helicase RuvA
MFNSVTGEITFKDEERLCILSAGIEWEFAVSRKALTAFPPVGEVTRVYTHLVHREDSMKLYGFPDPSERSLFLDLQRVEGMGPRGAMKILSGVDRERFTRALEDEDVDALSALPGVGRKTAQKIILTLKGKLTPMDGAANRSMEDDIAAALVGMGFDRRTAKSAVASAVKALSGAGVRGEEMERELLRKAVAIAGGQEARA